jgi:hypothetical protein
MRKLLAALGWLLLREERTWARAIIAELYAVPPGLGRVRFALSGAVALLRIAGDRALSRWLNDPAALAAAAGCGLLIGWIDVVSESRWPLRILLIGCCGGLGVVRPRTALVGGAVAGLAISLMGRLAGSAGPYAFDAGDAWWPVLPAIALSAVAAWIARRIAAFRSRRAE